MWAKEALKSSIQAENEKVLLKAYLDDTESAQDELPRKSYTGRNAEVDGSVANYITRGFGLGNLTFVTSKRQMACPSRTKRLARPPTHPPTIIQVVGDGHG